MDIFKNIIRDVKVELSEEFDRNFERKGFFDKPWPETKSLKSKGSLMMRSGALRRGNQSQVKGETIEFTNSTPYAKIHNEGGTITVTAKMIGFFWAMYYKSGGAAGKASGKRKALLSIEAQYWKSLALQKVGKKINIPKRQWIGDHPMVRNAIEMVMNDHLKNVKEFVDQKLKR